MDSETILDYWSSPFSFVQFGLEEEDVFSDPNPIVFMGGRGTGKTMFLRYCSHYVQREKFNKISRENLDRSAKFLEHTKGAGFYIRIDGPVLRSFNGFNVTDKKWEIIFAHFFELYVAKSLLNFIIELEKNGDLEKSVINSEFIEKCSKLITGQKDSLSSLEETLEYLDDRILEVTQFRSQIPLSDIEFQPINIFSSQTLSFGIPELAREYISDLGKDFSFVIMIDEYENFLESQQRIINTLLKFVKKGITFRIGMRLEGFRTYDTISTDDFIKEGRDYRNIIFEEVLIKDSGYRKYLKDIAHKRLSRIKCFSDNNLTDISNFLGDKEDLLSEAIDIVGNRGDKIFDYYKIQDKEDKDLLRCNENPLLQVLNCLWFTRGKSSKEIHQVMSAYLHKKDIAGVSKYKMDYVDKYKLSLTFIIASIFKKNKSYYSFNTFSFLSSGIVGHFIELCRRSFQHAEFEDKNTLIFHGNISNSLQNNAARDLAQTELQQSRRIEQYGNKLYVFTLNLGNIFADYHKDKNIKYPETNQFSTNKTLLDGEYKKAFEAAQRWSIIQKKPRPQQSSIGKHKNDIFTLNRIFSPIFQISYRTRGGFIEEFSTEDIALLMNDMGVVISKIKRIKKSKEDNNTQQELEF